MGIRITNSIMNNNSKNNMNVNKLNEDKLNTMMASGQKITRPSDDPVIAIRALRLNSNITQSNQYYDKNIPDADAWLKITETALTQTDTVLTKIKESLTAGASDDNTASDRMNILKDLQGMRDQIYAAGNADYADRTVFTGYRTGVSLTFTAAETREYSIKEEFTSDSIGSLTYVSGTVAMDKTGANADPSDPSYVSFKEQNVSDDTVYRIRLAYDNLIKGQSVSLKYKDNGTDTSVALTVTDVADDAAYAKPATGARLITSTGEIILSDELRDKLQASTTTDISIEYGKKEWAKNDLRPEHYFQCTDKSETPNIDYNKTVKEADGTIRTLEHFENQSISYEISFNQSITINTNANEVFTHDICRDVDELIIATQRVIDADSELDELKTMAADTTRYTEDQIKEFNSRIDAMTKKRDLLADNMQKMFSKGLTTFGEYADRNNMVLTEVGSTRKRLELTKERMSEQLSSFKELADENININLTDTAIDLSNAELALEAARMATGKIAQQSLLNFL